MSSISAPAPYFATHPYGSPNGSKVRLSLIDTRWPDSDHPLGVDLEVRSSRC